MIDKINLNETRRKGVQDGEVFNDCRYSDHEFDDEIASIDYQQNTKDSDDDS